MEPKDIEMLKAAHTAVRANLQESTKTAAPGETPGMVDQLSAMWEGLDPQLKTTLTNAGIGALAGGGLGGLAGGDIGSALTGALAGGVAGGAGTTAYNLLSGKAGLPGEAPNDPNVVSGLVDSATGGVMSNLPLAAGGALGGAALVRGVRPDNASAAALEKLRAMNPSTAVNIGQLDTSAADAIEGLGAYAKGGLDDAAMKSMLTKLRQGRIDPTDPAVRVVLYNLAQLSKGKSALSGQAAKANEMFMQAVADPNSLKSMTAEQAAKQLASNPDEGILSYLKRLVGGNTSGYNTQARQALRSLEGGRNPYLKTLGLAGGALGGGALANSYIKGDI